MAENLTETALMQRQRDEISKAKPEPVGKVDTISKEDALAECEYLGKAWLAQATPPTTPDEAQEIVNEGMRMVYAYLHKVKVHIPPKELIAHLFREGKANG